MFAKDYLKPAEIINKTSMTIFMRLSNMLVYIRNSDSLISWQYGKSSAIQYYDYDAMK